MIKELNELRGEGERKMKREGLINNMVEGIVEAVKKEGTAHYFSSFQLITSYNTMQICNAIAC